MSSRRSLVALAALATSCAAAPSPPPRHPAPLAPTSVPATAPAEAPAPSLAITITPDPRIARVTVEIVARGAPSALAAWSLAAPDPDAFTLASVRDDGGPLASHQSVASAKEGAALRITLDRPPVGAVHFAYSLAAHPTARGGKVTIDLDPNHLEAAGEALLALPDAFEEIARGALYTARVEAALRKKSAGQRGLESVLRELFAQAQAARGPLPTSAWVEALTKALDAGEAAAFTRAIEEGARVDLPEGALGPCFQGTTRTYAAFDAGFDDDATRDSATREVVGLRPGGPAEKAGLREGDVVVDEVVSRGRADVRVELTVERDGKTLKIGYLPVGRVAKGQGWLRKKDVPDDACTK